MIVFDLDGTLIDTREAVRRAYLQAGIVMPDDAWGKPWKDWLPLGALAHQEKNRYYSVCLEKYAQVLPLFAHARDSRAPILTGASADAVSSIERLFGQLNVVLWGATLTEKINWLSNQRPGIYVDDLESARTRIIQETTWIVLSPERAIQILRP